MKKALPTLLIVLVFLAGMAVFLYPTIANYLYEKNCFDVCCHFRYVCNVCFLQHEEGERNGKC